MKLEYLNTGWSGGRTVTGRKGKPGSWGRPLVPVSHPVASPPPALPLVPHTLDAIPPLLLPLLPVLLLPAPDHSSRLLQTGSVLAA